jgi:hypothetical protein
MQVGKTVTFKMRFIRGSSGSIDNGFGFEPPVPAHGDYITDFNNAFIGVAAYKDESTGSRYTGPIFINSLTRFRPEFHDGGAIDAISATYPFTDATGDELFCTGTYEAA